MSQHSKARLAVLAVSLAMAALVDAQSGKGPATRKIAVIAIRDSGLFTLCPVVGQDVTESRIWRSGMRARVTIAYVGGKQMLGFHFDEGITGRAMLPVATAQAGPPTATTPDGEGKAELEASIRARKGYAVVDSVAAADFVLIVESTFGSPPRPVTSGEQITEWRADPNGPGTWRQLSLAILVPAADYQQHAADPVALTAAAAWEGMAFAEWGRKNGVPSVTAASLEALIDQLNGKGRKQPASLPVCAVNGGAPY